jgi:SAM-dependent methyltransferase
VDEVVLVRPGVWTKAESIQGWYTQDESQLLTDLVRGDWCEIGCWKGRSTLILAETGYPGWAVDWFFGSPEHDFETNTFQEFEQNIGRYENVAIVRERFEHAVALVGKLSLLHLDGDHGFSATKKAFELYSEKVEPEGHVVFHDATGGGWPEVERFVNGLLAQGEWHRVATVGRSVAVTRCQER